MADVALTLLVLKTCQVEKLRLFYRTLGIEFAEEQHGNGPVHFAGQVGDVLIEVYPLPDDSSPVDSSTRLGFAVENVAKVIQALEGIGTKVVRSPTETAWGLRGVVRDPDGRSIDLCQRNN